MAEKTQEPKDSTFEVQNRDPLSNVSQSETWVDSLVSGPISGLSYASALIPGRCVVCSKQYTIGYHQDKFHYMRKGDGWCSHGCFQSWMIKCQQQ